MRNVFRKHRMLLLMMFLPVINQLGARIRADVNVAIFPALLRRFSGQQRLAPGLETYIYVCMVHGAVRPYDHDVKMAGILAFCCVVDGWYMVALWHCCPKGEPLLFLASFCMKAVLTFDILQHHQLKGTRGGPSEIEGLGFS